MTTGSSGNTCCTGREFPFKDCGEFMKKMRDKCRDKDGALDFEKTCQRMMKFCREMKSASSEAHGTEGEEGQDKDGK